MSEVKAMLANLRSSPPAFRLNLHRPKPLLVEFLSRYHATRIIAFDAEGSVYFDCEADAFCQSEQPQNMNWPLHGADVDAEKNLQLRDAIFPRHIEIIRQGYLAHHCAKPLGDGDVLHIDGDQAFQIFLASAESCLQGSALWLLLENCEDPQIEIAGFEQKFTYPNLGASVWGRPNITFSIDLTALSYSLDDALNRAENETVRQKSQKAEADLAYSLLRDIQYEESSFSQRLRQSLYLDFMYGAANLLAPIAPKRRDKLLRSARKRDPKVNDHRNINKSIRGYQQRLQLQERLINKLIVDDVDSNAPSFSVIFAFRVESSCQQVLNITAAKYKGKVQIVILNMGNSLSKKDFLQVGDDIDILFLNTPTNTSAADSMASAIESCTGDYILFADPHYIYDEYLFAAARKKLSAYSDTLILYTDEDEMDVDGTRSNPKYKPDWNRDLFYNTNYLGAPVFIERHLLRSLPEEIFCDLHDVNYAATLTALERYGDVCIQHLDMILASRKSAAHRPKISYCQLLLKEHLAHYGHHDLRTLDAKEPDCPDNGCLLDWSLDMATPPLVSMIIPTFNQLDLTRNAVTSILEKSRYSNFEILLVDNNSDDPDMLAWLSNLPKRDSRIRVLLDMRPFNFSAINNAAFCHAQGDIIALMNNDIEVISEEWLGEMVSQATRPDIGCVGAKLLYPDGKIQHAGVNIDLVGDMRHLMRMYPCSARGYMDRLMLQQNYLAVTGACLFIKRQLYARVGGLNQVELPIGCSDIDLCLKVQAIGLRNLWTPRATLIHHESISRGLDISTKKRARAAREHAFMCDRWKMVGEKDPYYNAAIDG